jgi:hypothetical protein
LYPCETVLDAFEHTKAYAESARAGCSPEEYRLLPEAFFSKRERLDRINREKLSMMRKTAPDKSDACGG